MWSRAFAGVLLVAVAVVAISGTSRTPVRRALVQEDVAAVEQALDRALPGFRVDDEPLEEALRRLGRAAGVEIVVDWSALAEGGVARTARVSLPQLTRSRLESVLDQLLRTASTSSAATLSFTVEQDYLLVTTEHRLDRYATIRVYDIRDFLEARPDLGPFQAERPHDVVLPYP